MFSTIRARITPAGVIAVIALVFAMLGGAYAAQGPAGNGKATASAKAKRGPRGPKGPKGPAGPQGPTGPAGPQGAAGPKGDPGANGTNGKDGISPAGTAFAGEAHGCKAGGVEFKGANTTFACNGVDGKTGFTETLPSGKTEFGQWSMQIAPNGEGLSTSSFNIPLSSSPTVVLIPEGKEEEFETECPGTALSPAAAKGFACFYTFFSTAGSALQAGGTVPTAQGVTFSFSGTEGETALGSWAATAE